VNNGGRKGKERTERTHVRSALVTLSAMTAGKTVPSVEMMRGTIAENQRKQTRKYTMVRVANVETMVVLVILRLVGIAARRNTATKHPTVNEDVWEPAARRAWGRWQRRPGRLEASSGVAVRAGRPGSAWVSAMFKGAIGSSR